jgi:hypothetical protein
VEMLHLLYYNGITISHTGVYLQLSGGSWLAAAVAIRWGVRSVRTGEYHRPVTSPPAEIAVR